MVSPGHMKTTFSPPLDTQDSRCKSNDKEEIANCCSMYRQVLDESHAAPKNRNKRSTKLHQNICYMGCPDCGEMHAPCHPIHTSIITA